MQHGRSNTTLVPAAVAKSFDEAKRTCRSSLPGSRDSYATLRMHSLSAALADHGVAAQMTSASWSTVNRQESLKHPNMQLNVAQKTVEVQLYAKNTASCAKLYTSPPDGSCTAVDHITQRWRLLVTRSILGGRTPSRVKPSLRQREKKRSDEQPAAGRIPFCAIRCDKTYAVLVVHLHTCAYR